MPDVLISVVLPLYNQADHLAGMVRDHHEALTRISKPFELILVPNGCVDSSVEICRALARELREVEVSESPSGWGRAVRTGLAQARGQWLCYTNSARTHPRDLELLVLYAMANPGAVVKANRKVRESLLRRLGSLLYNLECRMLFDLPQWDLNGTPKVFPRQFSRLLTLTRSDDLIDLEFNVICRRQNYPMIEVPILSARRHGGRSTTGLKTASRLLLGALRMKREWGNES